MEIDVALIPRAARTADGAVLVVIDQIRASTTLTTLLDLGCEDVVLAADVEAALLLGHATGRLVAGEWRARKPDGFDFDNSPSELSRADLGGRGVVLCTTNGTALLHRVRRARHVLIGCTRNARACAAAALGLATSEGTGIRVVCAGRQGRYVMEDAVAAGVIVARIADALRATGGGGPP